MASDASRHARDLAVAPFKTNAKRVASPAEQELAVDGRSIADRRQSSSSLLPTGLVTFVMTDVEGSTRLLREHSELYPDLLAAHRSVLRNAFHHHGGMEVDCEGDALFFAFPDASKAVMACIDAQSALATHQWPVGAQMRVRIGVHTEEAVPLGHVYVALAVHRVARITTGGHGGQILISAATLEALKGQPPSGSRVSPLGSFRLHGFSEPSLLFQVDHPDIGDTFPPLRLIGDVRHNLPMIRASFVGRTEELAAVTTMLLGDGLVTLVGLGGVGKTRLATQVAAGVVGHFPGGVWMVDLAALSDAASVLRVIADSVRVAEQPGRNLDVVLMEALSQHRTLLLLDNCEHLLDATAAVVTALSQKCPDLAILCTSRAPLAVDGEAIWRVDPLPVVPPQEADSALTVGNHSSARLFVDRARLARQDFNLTNDNARDVARVVDAVNGIPLAIELAAAALADRPLLGLVDALTDRFSLLSEERRAGPPRHRTLRAALEWSLDLLSAGDRQLFSRLAVFAGSASAAAVVGVSPDRAAADVVRSLRRLAVASLIVPHPDLPDRWSMLESVRQLAALELRQVGEDVELAIRHREWFAGRLERLAVEIGRTGGSKAMHEIVADQDNVRRAIGSAIAADDGRAALRLCVGMAQFWTSHGDWSEASETFQSTLELSTSKEAGLRAKALVAFGNLLLLRGDLTEAEGRLAEGHILADRAGDKATAARALSGQGHLAFRHSDLDSAQRLWTRALESAEIVGEDRVVAGVLRSLAISAGTRGNQDEARLLLDRAVRVARRAGDDQQVRLLLGATAELHMWLGEYEAAERAYGDALALASTIGDLSARPLVLTELGWLSLLQGDARTADRLSVDAAGIAEDVGNRRVWALALRLQGEALMRSGDTLAAAQSLSDALAVAEELHAPAEVAGIGCSAACLALEQGQYGEALRVVREARALGALQHTMRRVSLGWVSGTTSALIGDLETAEQEFSIDLASAKAAKLPRHEANSLAGLARIYTASDRRGRAARLERDALALRRAMGDRLSVVDSLIGIAAMMAPLEPSSASVLLEVAIRLRSQAGATPTTREDGEVAAVRATLAAGSDGSPIEPAARRATQLNENEAADLATQLTERLAHGASE